MYRRNTRRDLEIIIWWYTGLKHSNRLVDSRGAAGGSYLRHPKTVQQLQIQLLDKINLPRNIERIFTWITTFCHKRYRVSSVFAKDNRDKATESTVPQEGRKLKNPKLFSTLCSVLSKHFLFWVDLNINRAQ